jgi:hypothetical protein
MMLTLRGYQDRGVREILEAFEIFARLVAVAPTGSGKSILAAWLIEHSISKRKWNVCGYYGVANYEGCYVTLKNGRGYLLIGKSDEIYKSIVGAER